MGRAERVVQDAGAFEDQVRIVLPSDADAAVELHRFAGDLQRGVGAVRAGGGSKTICVS